MDDPIYTKGFSERFGKDFRVDEIQRYKDETIRISGILDEIAARKAEVVDSTPFDDLDDQIILQVIDERLKDLYSVIQSNSNQIKFYVKDAIEDGVQPLEESLEELHRKVDQLLPKKNIKREVLPLRDPLDINVYPIFLRHAGSSAKYKQDLKRSQLRINYTILYYVGLRINEIRKLTYKDIQNAIQARQFNIIHSKTDQSHIHILSPRGVEDLQNLSLEFQIVFEQYDYNYLFGNKRPMHKKSLIRMINEDFKNTSEIYKLPYNIKSHSFRVNVISSLLKITSVQKTAEIIGHEDIRSTLAYKRYSLSRGEIEDLLQQVTESNQ
jgi:integrase